MEAGNIGRGRRGASGRRWLMRFRPRARKPHPSMRLPLVALIDVVLFLLFYFMVAGTFSGEESALSATLGTDAKRRAQPGDLQPQVLSVKSQGGKVVYQIGDRVVENDAAMRGL